MGGVGPQQKRLVSATLEALDGLEGDAAFWCLVLHFGERGSAQYLARLTNLRILSNDHP